MRQACGGHGRTASARVPSAGGADCPRRHACPHLGFQACTELLAELGRLRCENADLRAVFGSATAAFRDKEQQLAALKTDNEVLRRKLADAHQAPFRKAKDDRPRRPLEAPPGQDQAPRKRGAPAGHPGATRPLPEREPDVTIEVEPHICPHCGSLDISLCDDTEDHIQEDIEIVRPKVTRYRKHRGYCRNCKRSFFPRGPGEIPHAHVGPVARAAAEYLHYAARVPGQGVARVFSALWGLSFTPPALVGFDTRTACAGRPLYDRIAEKAKYSATINVDESGWPVGPLHEWLWVLTNPDLTLFHIDPSRGSAVVKGVLGEDYGGVLGSDCFSGYNPVKAMAKQKCLTHYERAATEIEKFHPGDPAAPAFAAAVKDLMKQARQVRRDWLADLLTDRDATASATAFELRLDGLAGTALDNKDAENLRQRLLAHRAENFTFLRHRDVEPDNNRAERALRPSVVARKVSYGSNSVLGAWNHETVMSLLETGRLHGIAPFHLLMDLARGESPPSLQALFAPAAADPVPAHAAQERAPPG
jgi:transposase